MKIPILKLFVLGALVILYSLSNAQYQEFYIPELPKSIQLKLNQEVFKNYRQNIKDINNSKISNIEKIHKQYFPLDISFKKDSRTEHCEARARINGDWKGNRPLEPKGRIQPVSATS